MFRITLLRVCFLACVIFAGGCGSSTSTSGFQGGGEAQARGQVVRADYSSETFSLQPLTSWNGFEPVGDSVDVHTGGGTRFLNRDGGQMTAAEWYDYVVLNAAPSTAAIAKGEYTAGRIEAVEVRLD